MGNRTGLECLLLLKKWPSVRKVDEVAKSNKFSGNSNEEEEEFLDFQRPSNTDNSDVEDFASVRINVEDFRFSTAPW